MALNENFNIFKKVVLLDNYKICQQKKKLEKLLGELDKGDLYLNKLLLMFEKKLKQLSKKNNLKKIFRFLFYIF